MIRIVKNFDKVGLFVLALVFAVVLGVKAVERLQSTQWYSVTISNPSQPNNPENQVIGSVTSEPADGTDSFGCAKENPSTICAIELTLGMGVSKPATVAAADSTAGVTIEDRGFLPNP